MKSLAFWLSAPLVTADSGLQNILLKNKSIGFRKIFNLAKNSDCEPAFDIRINTNCPGNHNPPVEVFGQDHRICEQLCLEEDECNGFVWQGFSETNSKCWLNRAGFKPEMKNCRTVDGGKCAGGTCFAGFIDRNKCKGKIQQQVIIPAIISLSKMQQVITIMISKQTMIAGATILHQST